MAATNTEPVTRCRRCGVPIRPSPLANFWIDEHDYDSCYGGWDSHEPATVARVVDQITEWTDKDGNLNIRAGDLILRDYRFELVDRIRYDPAENLVVRVELAGHHAAMNVQPADLVAVRRYIEETP